MAEQGGLPERAVKRARTDNGAVTTSTTAPSAADAATAAPLAADAATAAPPAADAATAAPPAADAATAAPPPAAAPEPAVDPVSEESLGVSAFTAPELPGFKCVFKHRFGDFVVHEVDEDGQVVRLTDTSIPAEWQAVASAGERPTKVPDADDAKGQEAMQTCLGKVEAMFGTATRESLQAFIADESNRSDTSAYFLFPGQADKATRTTTHLMVKEHVPWLVSDTADATDGSGAKCVRLHFASATKGVRLTKTFDETVKRDGRPGKRKRASRGNPEGFDARERVRWPPGKPAYVSFVMWKRNRDHHDALASLTRTTRGAAAAFGFAGTKDKRGVTTQRGTAHRITPAKLLAANHVVSSRGLILGNFSFASHPLRLGMLRGNRFDVVLRDVSDADAATAAAAALRERGFINYFGHQRFGTSSVPTSAIGCRLLRQDLAGAIDLILGPKTGVSAVEAAARQTWLSSGRSPKAMLKVAPHFMRLERQLLEGLVKHGAQLDAAFAALPRTMRMLYAHAYQSYVWNRMATARVTKHGVAVVPGDLILTSSDPRIVLDDAAALLGDADDADAPPVTDDADATATAPVDEASVVGPVVRVSPVRLVRADEDTAKLDVTDVVLPLPGFAVTWPANEAGDAGTDVLREDGLTLQSFRQMHGYHLKGGYRRVFVRPADFAARIVRHSDADEPLVPDDEILMRDAEAAARVGVDNEDGKYTALVCSFTLPPGSYATMLIREMTKQSTKKAAQVRAGSTR